MQPSDPAAAPTTPAQQRVAPASGGLDVAAFLGLNDGDGDAPCWLTVSRAICGGRDSIYGGCALAAGIEAAERASGRATVWATCQFLAPAHIGERVDLHVQLSQSGRAVSHTRVIGRSGSRELFICLISLGERRFPSSGTWSRMPVVPGPEGLPDRYILGSHRGGMREHLVERAVTDDPRGIMRSEDGRACVWVTLPGGIPAQASALALIGDEVSTGTSAVIHPDAQAPSIDNTLRVVAARASRWVLAEIELRAAARGFAHGLVNLWSEDGQLLAIAEQTGALRMRGT